MNAERGSRIADCDEGQRVAARSHFILHPSAFTLIEMLTVIAIIGILAAFMLAGVSHAQWQARLATCKNQLHQFDLAIKIYSNHEDDSLPHWLSNLYPSYISTPKLYLCPQDMERGKEGGKPPWQTGESTEQFVETDDFLDSEAASEDAEAAELMNPDIEGNSYLYEFCCARCPFDVGPMSEVNPGGGKYTWRKAKEYQLQTIGPHTPLISCFWHTSGFFGNRDTVLRLGAETHHIYISDPTAEGWETDGL